MLEWLTGDNEGINKSFYSRRAAIRVALANAMLMQLNSLSEETDMSEAQLGVNFNCVIAKCC